VAIGTTAWAIVACNPLWGIDDLAPRSCPEDPGCGGAGGTPECTPGVRELCYSGPEGTRDVGTCHGGERTCRPDGRFGPCDGEVVPLLEQGELCGNDSDEDCDGVPCAVLVWASRFGDPQPQLATHVDAAESGDVVITGELLGDVRFGGDVLSAGTAVDLFLALFDTSGEHRFSRHADSDPDICRGAGSAIGGSGEVSVVGACEGMVDYGAGNVSADGRDACLFRYAANGVLASTPLMLGDGAAQHGDDIAYDAAGNFVVTGRFDGTMSGPGVTPVTAGPSGSMFALKLGLTNAWLREIPSGGYGIAPDYVHVATDPLSGDVVVGGYASAAADFGGGVLAHGGGRDALIVKYAAATGEHRWSKLFGDAADQVVSGIAVAPGGRVVATVSFQGAVTLAGRTLESRGIDDVLVASFDEDGDELWIESFGDASSQHARGVAVDAAGAIVVAMSFQGRVDTGAGTLSSAGDFDCGIVKLAENGAPLWARGFGGATVDSCGGIDVDGLGNVYLTGQFDSSIDFGAGPLQTAGESDIFLAKLTP
jgi:hypothetical protein